MILELKLRNGEKFVIGGDFTFLVDGNKQLALYACDGRTIIRKLKDYPTYSVGGNFVYCEEMEGKHESNGRAV